MKKLKSGINQAIICKNCGKQVGTIRMKSRLKWRSIKWMIIIGLAFEIVANAVVYLIFK